jgi:type VI secretion system protein ImpH
VAGQDWRLSSDMKSALLHNGNAFSFYQVIRLLRLLQRNRPTGEEKDVSEHRHIRIRPKLSLAFPHADVDSIEELEGEEPRYQVNTTFLGLYGSSSPLPMFYTEDLMEEASSDESVSRDFLDIFNHRLYMLLFKSWSKYRQHIKVVEERDPMYLERLFCLVGLSDPAFREDIPEPTRLIRYAGLLTQFPRSSLGLQTLLKDALGGGISLKIIPCVGAMTAIPEEQKFHLGISGCSLGEDSFLGNEILDRTSKFRIQIGPLQQDQYQEFLPGASKYHLLTFLTNFYLVEPLKYDVECILSAVKTQPACLSAPRWSALGMDTWMFSGEAPAEMRAVFYPQS